MYQIPTETYKFSFKVQIPTKDCNDMYLQWLADRLSEHVYSLKEIQRYFKNFEEFDEQFCMDIPGG